VYKNDYGHCAGTTKVAVKVMDIEGVDMTRWGGLFQLPSTGSSNREGPITDG